MIFLRSIAAGRFEMNIGDVVKINIEGEMVPCIILSDLIKSHSCPSPGGFNYLSLDLNHQNGHSILNDQVILWDYYKTLIGDQIVYVEIRDILE